MPKKQDTSASDIDLFVISDKLSYANFLNQLVATEEQLGRSINTTIYTPLDVRQRLQEGNAFLARVFEEPKIWIVGDETDIPS
uniref:hypothetical protein n=1 Tax=Orrella sp. TaxID=1921583 RepID=UPI0040485CB0